MRATPARGVAASIVAMSANRPTTAPDAASLQARLRSGTPVRIRPVRPDDRQRVIDAFHKLEPQTVYTRFFGPKRELSEADLSRIEASDFVRAVALVASVGEGPNEILIGGGAYTVLERPGEAASAELSFTIEEDYQGQGLATLLLRQLTRIGRAHGIQRFEAEVLAENRPMLKVFERSGLPLHSRVEDGVVHVTMALGGSAA